MKRNAALTVMAAGIGSRYGKGIKQLAKVGPSGEIIMDYSVHDALAAGFDKIIFIIRKDIEKEFRDVIGRRMEKIADVAYVFQELDDLPDGFSCPPERKKPWGTGQAILAAREEINGPFAVINADDYYGKSAFVTLYDYLQNMVPGRGDKEQIATVSFRLGNTLSDHGGVTRGICLMDDENHLTGVRETKNIIRNGDGAAVQLPDGTIRELDPDLRVSMNMWGLDESFLDVLDGGFRAFLTEAGRHGYEGEFLLPTCIDGLIREGRAEVCVLRSEDSWFGVTYQEDRPIVVEAFRALTEQGAYGTDLYADLNR
jgi:hypothetical protein